MRRPRHSVAFAPRYARRMDGCKRRANSLIAGPLCSLLQEPLVTMRAGRYDVVPVKQEYRTTFRGDYPRPVRPAARRSSWNRSELVDLNNQWRQAQIEEQQEIERILLYLSGVWLPSARTRLSRR